MQLLPRLLSLGLALGASVLQATAMTPNVPAQVVGPSTEMLPTPIPPHPRIMSSEAEWERVKQQCESDPFSAQLLAAMKQSAEVIMDAPQLEHVLEGRRLLTISRQALTRLCLLSTLHRITGEDRYAARAEQELRTVCSFPDWNPKHFLDTAEMALAVSIGYDWLYDSLDEDTRALVEKALVEMAIEPSFDERYNWWVTFGNNWNQVCQAGISAAVIALADKRPQLAEQVLLRAAVNLPLAGKAYGPDGAFPEGPMYWSYATEFHCVLADLLISFTGSGQGVDTQPGLDRTGRYIYDVTGPSGAYFNYSDCSLMHGLSASMFWLAARFDHPEWLSYDLSRMPQYMETYSRNPYSNRVLPLALLWHKPADTTEFVPQTASLYRGRTPVFFFRFGDGPTALWAGIKAGSPSASHGQMDVGTFVLEADGVRWLLDLGMQNYHSIEKLGMTLWDNKQDSQRWDIFRLGAESHNIPRFNGLPQLVFTDAEFVRSEVEGSRPFCVIDMSETYGNGASKVLRGMRMLDGKALLLQDEWAAQPGETVDAAFQFMTAASSIQVRGSDLLLGKDGETFTLRILDGADVSVEVQDVSDLLQPYDAENPGVSRIVLKTGKSSGGTLRVLMVPGSSGSVQPPPARKLADW